MQAGLKEETNRVKRKFNQKNCTLQPSSPATLPKNLDTEWNVHVETYLIH